MKDPLRIPASPGASGQASATRIVVGVDDSAAGVAALQRAVELARSYRAELVAIRAWALGLPGHGGRRRRRHGRRRVVLVFPGHEQRQVAAELVRRTFGAATGGVPADLAVRVETPEGDPAAVLTGFAARPDDLLVVGTQHNHALKALVHGSVSAYCLKHARCPVVTVESGRHPAMASIRGLFAEQGAGK